MRGEEAKWKNFLLIEPLVSTETSRVYGPVCFVLSDTFDSNKKMLENLEIRPEDILSPNDPDAVDKIVAEIDKERDDLLEYREKVKRWKSFNKKLDINSLDDLLEFYDPVTM